MEKSSPTPPKYLIPFSPNWTVLLRDAYFRWRFYYVYWERSYSLLRRVRRDGARIKLEKNERESPGILSGGWKKKLDFNPSKNISTPGKSGEEGGGKGRLERAADETDLRGRCKLATLCRETAFSLSLSLSLSLPFFPRLSGYCLKD